MQVIECWSIQVWDGDDRLNHSFYLTSEKETDKYLAAHKHDVAQKVVLTIFDTAEEAVENSNNEVRKRALAKLTLREKMALGL